MSVHRASTMAHRGTMCAKALYDACVALALADAGDVYAVAFGEYVSLEYIAQVVGRHVVKTEFLQVLLYCLASLLQMAELRLVELALFHVGKTELYCIVAFLFLCLDLGDRAGASFDYGNRDYLAVSVENLGHANFLADDCLLHFCFLLVGYWLMRGFRPPT